MLTIYHRHTKICKRKAERRATQAKKSNGCRCPIWIQGTALSVPVRRSLKNDNWTVASKEKDEWEEKGLPEMRKAEPSAVTVEQATQSFLDSRAARDLKPSTMKKLRVLVKQLRQFAGQHGIVYLKAMTLEDVRAFRASWKDKALAASKKLERFRSFFRFSVDSGWLSENPAARIERPIVRQKPTMPFEPSEMQAIIGACDLYPDKVNGLRLRALVLLMRFSGLRIGDAASLAVSKIQDGKLALRTAKTGTRVSLPLPPEVLEALRDCPRVSNQNFFWSGTSKADSLPWIWGRSLAKLFKLAGVQNGHSHRFRDTFSVELLLAEVPLERVAVLLGHSSVKVTETHYAPWVRARQDQLEADVRRTWSADRRLHPADAGTPQVHGQERVM